MPSTRKKNPAPFNKVVLATIATMLTAWDFRGTILDPFAGEGGVHKLPWFTIGIELEPEWAEQVLRWTRVGNALNLEFPDETFDAIVTSPTYGNRYADHHNAQDGSTRYSYKHNLGRDPSPDSSAVLQWGDEYRDFHRRAWKEAVRVLKSSYRGSEHEMTTGFFILNIKNHIRGGKVQRVAEWHRDELKRQGLAQLGQRVRVPTPGARIGANAEARVDHEYVYAFIKL